MDEASSFDNSEIFHEVLLAFNEFPWCSIPLLQVLQVFIASEAFKHFPFFISLKKQTEKVNSCKLVKLLEWNLICFSELFCFRFPGGWKLQLVCWKCDHVNLVGKVYTLQPFFYFTNRPQNHQTMARIFLVYALGKKKKLLQSYFRYFCGLFHSSIYAIIYLRSYISYLFPTIYFNQRPRLFTFRYALQILLANAWEMNGA